jgi:nitrite reductase/ring-hydroxylating ferredoxin subunit
MKKPFFIILMLISFISCTKDENETIAGIPYVEVDEKVDINDAKFQKLNQIGGWAYLDAGARGIILYRPSNEIVLAYERQCPYDAVSVCSTIDLNPFTLKINDNDCCGSEYNLTNGSVFKGPATRPLKQYIAFLEGDIIVVRNQ